MRKCCVSTSFIYFIIIFIFFFNLFRRRRRLRLLLSYYRLHRTYAEQFSTAVTRNARRFNSGTLFPFSQSSLYLLLFHFVRGTVSPPTKQ